MPMTYRRTFRFIWRFQIKGIGSVARTTSVKILRAVHHVNKCYPNPKKIELN